MNEESLRIIVLEELYRDSRMSSIDLARKLEVSRQRISGLKNRLWEENVIHSPTILINPNAADIDLFFVMISVGNIDNDRLFSELNQIPEISAFHTIIGEKTILVQFLVRTQIRYNEILHVFDDKLDNEKIKSYTIIDPLDYYKIGGFSLRKKQNVFHLTEKRWNVLQFLQKNNNPRKWPIREHDQTAISQNDIEYIESMNYLREIYRFNLEGIIQCFTIRLKEPISSFNTKYIFQMKPKKNTQYKILADKLIKNPHIIELYRTGQNMGLFGIYCTTPEQPVQDIVQNLYEKYDIQELSFDLIINEKIPIILPPTFRISKKISEF